MRTNKGKRIGGWRGRRCGCGGRGRGDGVGDIEDTTGDDSGCWARRGESDGDRTC